MIISQFEILCLDVSKIVQTTPPDYQPKMFDEFTDFIEILFVVN